MNLLSWILLAAIALWFVIAVLKTLKNKGCACHTNAGNDSPGAHTCTGCCATCGHCKR